VERIWRALVSVRALRAAVACSNLRFAPGPPRHPRRAPAGVANPAFVAVGYAAATSWSCHLPPASTGLTRHTLGLACKSQCAIATSRNRRPRPEDLPTPSQRVHLLYGGMIQCRSDPLPTINFIDFDRSWDFFSAHVACKRQDLCWTFFRE
jgi:hypothetical protein